MIPRLRSGFRQRAQFLACPEQPNEERLSNGPANASTFSCYRRRALFTAAQSKQVFEAGLERVRRAFGLCVYGYVVMPDHVHLLLSEPQHGTLADALKSLKQGVSHRLIAEAEHFWQKRYYDFNIRNHAQFVEKLRYIHRNPGSPASPVLACWGGSRRSAGFVNVRKTGNGAAFCSTPPAVKDG
jgi:REP element-mobilizing transposase RayT